MRSLELITSNNLPGFKFLLPFVLDMRGLIFIYWIVLYLMISLLASSLWMKCFWRDFRYWCTSYCKSHSPAEIKASSLFLFPSPWTFFSLFLLSDYAIQTICRTDQNLRQISTWIFYLHDYNESHGYKNNWFIFFQSNNMDFWFLQLGIRIT